MPSFQVFRPDFEYLSDLTHKDKKKVFRDTGPKGFYFLSKKKAPRMEGLFFTANDGAIRCRGLLKKFLLLQNRGSPLNLSNHPEGPRLLDFSVLQWVDGDFSWDVEVLDPNTPAPSQAHGVGRILQKKYGFSCFATCPASHWGILKGAPKTPITPL
jgi:hypothetical protein